ncbi:MAG: isoprenylcysteine carboxylmethyltransferase family protein [Phycisphaerae bacterium]|nr:isoprenylcysteine carboxylmethyltransferase family protein [Phycisphaerae bacterium]
MAKRSAVLTYGIVCYTAFLLTFLALIGFVTDIGLPKTIDNGPIAESGLFILLNAIWPLLFGLQHAVMARPRFKSWWTRVIPPAAERSTFVLIASAILAMMMWQWRTMPTVIWAVDSGWGRVLLLSISFSGWGTALYSSFLINHFDLFGLRQVFMYFRGVEYRPVPFSKKSLYRYVRHPLMLGFLIAFWAIPTMTLGHLMFASIFTAYILLGTRIEERDLLTQIGDDYRRYRAQTPMLIPQPFRKPVEVGEPRAETA